MPISERHFLCRAGLRHGRALLCIALVTLAGCGGGTGGQVADGDPVDCLLPGKSGFEKICTVDRMKTPEGTVLTVREPNGGFRRLLIVKDGRGVVAADGAEPVTVKPQGQDGIEVTVDQIRYRLPARIAP